MSLSIKLLKVKVRITPTANYSTHFLQCPDLLISIDLDRQKLIHRTRLSISAFLQTTDKRKIQFIIYNYKEQL